MNEPQSETGMPEVASAEEWVRARERLLAREKELMRTADELAAERRRLPMVEVSADYTFEGPGGESRLVDLFEGRRQLALYHFMFDPEWEEGCNGCSMCVDNFGHPAHLHARDTTLALVSRAPLEKLERFRERMGWALPWYSSHGSRFNYDFGTTTDDGETFGLSVFIRDDDDRVYRTYFTDRRGVEPVASNWAILDRTPLGRQEHWEKTPAGRPQGPAYTWWRLHDAYE